MAERQLSRKKMMRALLFILIALPVATSQTLVWQSRQQNLLVRTLIVPPSEFNVGGVERLFRRLLSETANERGFIDIRVYPSFEAASANCKCQSDITYQVWKGQFDEQRTQPLPGAELISYGASSAMLFRSPSGVTESKILRGADPRVFDSLTCSAELLYVSAAPPSYNERVDSPQATFYFRSAKEPTEQCARELAQGLSTKTRIRAFDLWLRSDAWFIEDELFPILYAFDNSRTPPSEADYKASKTAGCVLAAGKFSCWER
jgi:hypothetical protein